MKNYGTRTKIVIFIFTFSFLVVLGCENKNKIREEINSIKIKILKIDRAISYLISKKRGSNSPIINVYPNGSFYDPYIRNLLNEMNARNNHAIDAQIYQLKSVREILMLEMETLIKKL